MHQDQIKIYVPFILLETSIGISNLFTSILDFVILPNFEVEKFNYFALIYYTVPIIIASKMVIEQTTSAQLFNTNDVVN